MRRSALMLAAASLLIAAAPSAPHAKGKLQANVVSMPSALAPGGKPVPVVFEVYVLDRAGTIVPVGGSTSEVAVELVALNGAAEGRTHPFPADHLGDGRYAAEIVFPAGGDWALRVAIGPGHPGIPLGKGAVHVPAPVGSAAAAAPVRAAGLLLAPHRGRRDRDAHLRRRAPLRTTWPRSARDYAASPRSSRA